MRTLIVILLLLLVPACGTNTQAKNNLDLYALLRAAAPSEAQLMEAVKANAANLTPVERPASLSANAFVRQSHYVFEYELIKVDERIVGNLGYIDYEFVYQEVGGPVYEGNITANFVFQTNKFVADVPPYTVQGGGVTTLLIGNVQNALLDAMSPEVSRDAELTGVLVTVEYDNGNVRGTKTDDYGNFSLRVFSNANVVLKATYEDFEEYVADYVVGSGANPIQIDMWPRPTLVNAGLVQVSGKVSAANAPQLVPTEGAVYPVQDAFVSLTLPSGRVILSKTNANGQYLMVAVPPGTHTFVANKGSKRGEDEYIITLDGPNTGKDITLPDTRPYCELTVSPMTVAPGEIVTLTATATDDNGDPLYFTYDSDSVDGVFLDLPGYDENTNRWQVPTIPGTYRVYATVDDGALTHECDKNVTVAPQTLPQLVSVDLHFASCAVVTTDGEVACRGLNEYGALGSQLSNTLITNAELASVLVESTNQPLKGVTEIVSGRSHSCALTQAYDPSGEVYCWGSSNYLGIGMSSNHNKAVPVHTSSSDVSGLRNVKKIAATELGGCAILNDHTLKCWGRNEYGMLGNGTASSSYSEPVFVIDPNSASGLLENVQEVSSGRYHICAVASSPAKLYCWGRLDYSSSWPYSTPTAMQLNGQDITNIVAMDAGATRICVSVQAPAEAAASTYCSDSSAGFNSFSLVVDAYGNAVPDLRQLWVDMGMCALQNTSTGQQVVCWGPNANPNWSAEFASPHEPLPLLASSVSTQYPVVPNLLPTPVYSIQTGYWNTCAIAGPNRDWLCFGDNHYAQYGYYTYP